MKRRASEILERLKLVIVVSAQIQHNAPNGIGGILAVVENGIPGWVPIHRLILAKGYQQITKRLLRNAKSFDRLPKRNEHGVCCGSRVALVQLTLPPIQQLECCALIGDFISK